MQNVEVRTWQGKALDFCTRPKVLIYYYFWYGKMLNIGKFCDYCKYRAEKDSSRYPQENGDWRFIHGVRQVRLVADG